LINEAMSVAWRRGGTELAAASKFFVSRARKNASVAKSLSKLLKRSGFEVFLGDDEGGTDQTITASIAHRINSADVFVTLWDEHYARSPWCFDEINQALQLKQLGALEIWLFILDDSLIVPPAARRLCAISVRSESELMSVVADQLSRRRRRLGGDALRPS
jgi:hypothetical protein